MKLLIILNALIVAPLNLHYVYAASFQGVGDLPGGGFDTLVLDISGDGSIVVGEASATFGTRAFKWDWSDGIIELPGFPVDTTQSTAHAVSYDGSVIVGNYTHSSVGEAFKWEGNTVTGLGILSGGSHSSAKALSSDGSVIVGNANSINGNEVFRWENNIMSNIGELPGGNVNGSATSVSSDGSIIVGGSDSELGFQGFQYKNGIMTPLKTNPPTKNTLGKAQGVNADGSKIVGWLVGSEPVMWTDPNTFIELGDLPGGNSNGVACDITPDGTVVVGRSSSFNGSEAFIWDSVNGMRNLRQTLIADYGLDLTGWVLDEAVAISDDGLTIAGNGRNPNGPYEGWVARLGDPLPSCQYILGGDLNGDCKINIIDFSVIVLNWLINCDIEPTPVNCIPKIQ